MKLIISDRTTGKFKVSFFAGAGTYPAKRGDGVRLELERSMRASPADSNAPPPALRPTFPALGKGVDYAGNLVDCQVTICQLLPRLA